jgi:hypothetical protein
MMPLPRRRVDLDAEDQRRPALQILRKRTAALVQERVSVAVGLDGVEALEEQQGFQGRLASRVAFADGGEIGSRRNADPRRLRNHAVEDRAQQCRRNMLAPETVGQNEVHGAFEARLVQHADIDEARHDRLRGDHRHGCLSDIVPEWIGADGGGDGAVHRETSR